LQGILVFCIHPITISSLEANFSYHHSTIHYHLYGQGPLLLCLHGYNHNTRSFWFLQRHLEDRFTVLAIDMPYHGATVWQEQRPFTPEDLHTIVLQLQPQANKEVHLFGYSMGGRLALAYFQQYPEAVKSISLVAPDGLHGKLWYSFVTQTRLGNRFFHNTMHNPAWLHRFIRTTDRYKLVPSGLTSAANYFLNNEAGRLQLYNRWTSLSRFHTRLPLICKYLGQYKVPLRLLFGQTDPIVSYKHGQQFQKRCPKQVSVTIISAGHFLMNERYAADILKLLSEAVPLSKF
jgi:pimeloyl-ACP methyl ester carboxylesterase